MRKIYLVIIPVSLAIVAIVIQMIMFPIIADYAPRLENEAELKKQCESHIWEFTMQNESFVEDTFYGKWDEVNNRCLFITNAQCNEMNGIFSVCAPMKDKWTANCISACQFE